MFQILMPAQRAARGQHIAVVSDLPATAPECLVADRVWVTRHVQRQGGSLYLASFWGESSSIRADGSATLTAGVAPPFLMHPLMQAVTMTTLESGEINGQPLYVKQAGSIESKAAVEYHLLARTDDFRLEVRVLVPSLHPAGYVAYKVTREQQRSPDYARIRGALRFPGAAPIEIGAAFLDCRCHGEAVLYSASPDQDPSGETARALLNIPQTRPLAATTVPVR